MSAFGLWRQLPYGTVGAYQLMANLISLGKVPKSAPPARGRIGEVKAFVSTIVVVLLVSGATLLGYARWTSPLTDGRRRARRRPSRAGGRQLPAGGSAVRRAARREADRADRVHRAVGNHLLALYRLKRYDEVIDLAQKAPAAARRRTSGPRARSSRRPSSRKRPKRASAG